MHTNPLCCLSAGGCRSALGPSDTACAAAGQPASVGKADEAAGWHLCRALSVRLNSSRSYAVASPRGCCCSHKTARRAAAPHHPPLLLPPLLAGCRSAVVAPGVAEWHPRVALATLQQCRQAGLGCCPRCAELRCALCGIPNVAGVRATVANLTPQPCFGPLPACSGSAGVCWRPAGSSAQQHCSVAPALLGRRPSPGMLAISCCVHPEQ